MNKPLVVYTSTTANSLVTGDTNVYVNDDISFWPNSNGSITIDSENCAKVTRLTPADLSRLRNIKRGITRIITKFGASLAEVLKSHDIKHGPIKRIGGGCGSSFYITDIMNKEDVTMLSIAMIGKAET